MIETPLDTLTLRRETFVKSLYDGIGLTEAAQEYLEAHFIVTKMDIYYNPVYNEEALLMIAKQEGEEYQVGSGGIYGVDYAGLGTRSATEYIEPGTNRDIQGDQSTGQRLLFDTKYMRDVRATNFDNAPSPTTPVKNNHYFQSENNPMMGTVTHTFSDGRQEKIPAWYASLLNYYTVSDDDEHHAGMSRAEYDNGRVKGWLEDGRELRTRNVANMRGMLNSLSTNHGSNFHRLKGLTSYYLTPLQRVEQHYDEVMNGDFTLKDYFHGFEGLDKKQRENIYQHLLKNGYDDIHHHLDEGGIHSDQIRFSLGLRLKPLMDFLTRSSAHSSDNHMADTENVAAEHAEIPNHVWDSMFSVDKEILHRNVYRLLGLDKQNEGRIKKQAAKMMEKNLSLSYADALAEATMSDMLRYDMFEFDNKTNTFSMDELGGIPAKNFVDWHNNKATSRNLSRSGFYAAVGWDNSRGKHYEYDKKTGENLSPVEGFEHYPSVYRHFNENKVKEIEGRMKTGRDAIYDGTHMRNQAIPWMNRLVDLTNLGDFMGGDHRGFNHMFAEMFQHGGGHHLDLNNALRVIAPIFHHISTKESSVGLPSEYGENLLFDIEHPEMYSRRSYIDEDPDKDLYYIGPKEEWRDGKKALSTSNALAWAGQPQLTRFFHNVYDEDDWDNYTEKLALWSASGGETSGVSKPSKPTPKKKIMRSLGSIPHAHMPNTEKGRMSEQWERKLARRAALQEMAEQIEPSAHLSQYVSRYRGYARGTGGLPKGSKGVTHSFDSSKYNQDHDKLHMRSTNPNKDRMGKRRLDGQSSIRGEYEAIPGTFATRGPGTHRKEISQVDQQTRADFNKNKVGYGKHEMTGAGNSPVSPQIGNVLGMGEATPFNKIASDLLSHHATRDDVTRTKELRDLRDDAIQRKNQRYKLINQAESKQRELEEKMNTLPSNAYEERDNLIREWRELDGQLSQYKQGNPHSKPKVPSTRSLEASAKHANKVFNKYEDGPKLTKKELMDKINQAMFSLTDNSDVIRELEDEHERLLEYQPNERQATYRKHRMKKYDSDMAAIGKRVQHLREMLDSQGIPIGDDPFEMLSNLMVLAHEGERDLHSYEPPEGDKTYMTYSESVDHDATKLSDEGKTHNMIRDLIINNGQHLGNVISGTRLNERGHNIGFMSFDNDNGNVSRQLMDLMRGIQDAHTHLSKDELATLAPRIRQMSVRELLQTMHPELKGDVLEHPASIQHGIAMKELLHLDDNFQPTDMTERLQEQMGMHFIPARHGKGAMHDMLDGHLVIDPSTDTEGVGHIKHPSFKNRDMPISNISKVGGYGVNCFFTDPNDHFKWSGFKPTIKPIRDNNHKFIGWERVEPYDYDSRTPPMSIYEQGVPELVGRLGEIDDSRLARPKAFSTLFLRQDESSPTLLLASLSNPDIMLKKDGEYPILQPMHRIFKLDDLEHLRGFSGDWIVSAMPEGPRAFVEKKDDKITVRGDFDLDKETKENFEKISKKNFVVDVVLAGKEYNVIDIVEYDDSDVHDMPLQERIKILRGTMESTENVLLPAAHNLRLTDDVGLEVIVKDLLKEHKRLVLRDANSTYMKGENRHPKWVLYDEGQDVNLMVLDKKGTSSFTYRLGTGPITHEDSLGDRAVEYEGDTYMDVGTSFQSEDEYEVGDIVTVNVDSISVTESVEGADIYTVNSNEIKGEAEGEGVSSVETLSMFIKSEPMMWPHEIDRDGDRIVIKMAAGDVSYRASAIDGEWYMFNPKAENGWLIRLAESQRPFWSPVAGVMLKADLSLYDDESKAEVHESKNDAKPLIPPKKVKNTSFWDSEIDEAIEHKKKVKRLLAKSLALASSMLKSGVGAVGDSSTGTMGLGIDYATPIESPSGPTSLVGSKTMPDHDARDVERDKKERAEDKKMGYREPVDDEEAGHLSIDKDKAAFVPY